MNVVVDQKQRIQPFGTLFHQALLALLLLNMKDFTRESLRANSVGRHFGCTL
jgi:hypothetical protein